MKEKINLMHIVQDMDAGGLERLVYETTRVTDRNQFNIEVCCFDSLGFFADQLEKIDIKSTLLQRNQEKFDKFYIFRLAKFLRERKVDVMQIHSGAYFFGSIAGALARVPVIVYTDHGRFLHDTKHRMRTDRIAAKFTDKIIAVSKELEKYLIEVVKLPASKIVTVINGINTDDYLFNEKDKRLISEFSLEGSFPIIGTVGRLDEVKNHKDLINAIQIVLGKYPNAKLVIVGDGPLNEQLHKQVAEAKLEDSVILAGFRKDIPELLSLLDIFALPSLSEGTPISLLEAMSAGIVCVANDVGGVPSIIENEVDGVLIKAGDYNALARSFVELSENREKAKSIAKRGQEKARNKYGIARMVEQYTAIYKELLKKKNKQIKAIDD